jgi:signal transduction histidine kinase
MLFAALLTVISIPVFYFSLNSIFNKSIDKYLHYEADAMPAIINTIQSERELQLWRTLDKDLDILPADSTTFSDQPFNTDNFRILQKKVDVLGKSYVVSIRSSLVEKDDLIRAILFIQLGILFVLLAGAVIINYLINRKVWTPFYESLDFIKRFNVEHFMVKDPGRIYIREFDQLNQSVNALLARLNRSYYSQKEFLENVSHELKTPLTILKFKLELLLQDQQLTQEQSLLVADMHKELGQMQELNNNLLLLSKIENRQFETDETVDIIYIVKDVLEELSLLAESKLQTFAEQYAGERLLLRSNTFLLKILVRNLLVNAIRYSETGAMIQVVVLNDRLDISNPGEEMDMAVDTLFGSRSRNGLGLAIVKNIADYNRYTITYAHTGHTHTFSLRWG